MSPAVPSVKRWGWDSHSWLSSQDPCSDRYALKLAASVLRELAWWPGQTGDVSALWWLRDELPEDYVHRLGSLVAGIRW